MPIPESPTHLKPVAGPVAVVGAGIIGLAIAFRLVLAGKRVVLIDRQAPGMGCSYGNAGVIATDSIEPLASSRTLALTPKYLLGKNSPVSIHPRYAMQIAPWLARFAAAAIKHTDGVTALKSLLAPSLASITRLMADAGCGALLFQRGYLLVCERAGNKHKLLDRQRWFAKHSIDSKWLDQAAVRRLAPDLTESVYGGLLFPDTGHVADSLGICRALQDAFVQRGGELMRADVRNIRCDIESGFVLECADRQIDASKLVIAAGGWSRPLAQQLGHRLPLEVERGYHLTATDLGADLSVPIASFERHTFMTPMTRGTRITGFVEFGGLQLPPRQQHFDRLQQHLSALLPRAKDATLTSWMGGRPSLPDHLPVIGRTTKHPNAVLAVGHQHLGLTLCGITADLVCALLDEQPVAIDMQPFRCDRFN